MTTARLAYEPVSRTAVLLDGGISKECTFQFIRETATRQAPSRTSYSAYESKPVYPGACGVNWYTRCSGDMDYWDKDDEYRRKHGIPGNIRGNLLYGREWYHARPKPDKRECGMILLVANYHLKWIQPAGASTGRRAVLQQGKHPDTKELVYYIKAGQTTRVYAVIKTWQELLRIYKSLGMADRHMEEIILDCTPHKLYLDVERDLHSPLVATTDDTHLQLREVLEKFEGKFLDYLVDFCRDVLGISTVQKRDLVVSYSSKRGVKFSAHVVLSTPQNHYFQDRIQSHVAASLMAKFMHERAGEDEEFKEWYYYDHNKVMVDYSVYGKGQRNMRMIGCCKMGPGLTTKTDWRDARVFTYKRGDKDRPIRDYIISVYEAITNPEKYTAMTLSKDKAKEAYLFARGDGMRFIRSVDVLRQHAGLSESTVVVSGALGGSAAATTSTSGPAVAGDAALHGLTSKLGAADLQTSLRIGESIREATVSWDEYYAVGKKIITDVCEGLHPGNNPRLSPSDRSSAPVWLWRARMTAFVPGITREDGQQLRYCAFGCTSGQHEVRIYLFNDFSVGYYCYGHRCPTRAAIVSPSPIQRKDQVRPGVAGVHEFMPEFQAGLVDYDEIEPGPGDDNQHMRTMHMPEEHGGSRTDKMTYVLHGGMGTGKTTAVKRLIDRCREMRTDGNSKPRILSISFRVMLAKNASETLGLQHYKGLGPADIRAARNLALQLDSIEKLLIRDGNEDGDLEQLLDFGAGTPAVQTFKLEVGHDIVVLDELCSLLAHMASSTLGDKLDNVWNIFYSVVKNARILVCCDADMGAREQRFILMTRGVSNPDNSFVIPGLRYHWNHYIGIKTKFIDYKGEYEWAMKILECAVGRRMNCFIASNSLSHINALKLWLEVKVSDIADDRMKALVAARMDPDDDDELEFLRSLKNSMKAITSETTESEKNRMSDSNKTWVYSRVLLISPTVGAGVDFQANHFDASFVYATSRSCCARAINQMRGRARSIATGECHVYISSVTATGGEDGLQSLLPKTASEAVVTLERNRNAYKAGPVVGVGEVGADGMAIFSSHCLVPENLVVIQAYNLAERNRSHLDIRMEWIKLQQSCDPEVEYVFHDQFDAEKNAVHLAQMNRARTSREEMAERGMAMEKDMSLEVYHNTISLDRQNRMREVERNPTRAAARLDKNKVRHFYGMREGIGETEFLDLLKVIGSSQRDLEQLDRVIHIFFMTVPELEELARAQGRTVGSTALVVVPNTAEPDHTFKTKQRMAQEFTPTEAEVRRWFEHLMFACGADSSLLGTDVFTALEFHRGLASRRLFNNESGIHGWLQTVAAQRYETFGMNLKKGTIPLPGTRWVWKNAYQFTKTFMETVFGLALSVPDAGKDKEARQRSSCPASAGHVFRYADEEGKMKRVQCTKAMPPLEDLEILVEKAFARVTSKEPPAGILSHRESILKMVKSSVLRKKFHSGFTSALADRGEGLEYPEDEIARQRRAKQIEEEERQRQAEANNTNIDDDEDEGVASGVDSDNDGDGSFVSEEVPAVPPAQGLAPPLPPPRRLSSMSRSMSSVSAVWSSSSSSSSLSSSLSSTGTGANQKKRPAREVLTESKKKRQKESERGPKSFRKRVSSRAAEWDAMKSVFMEEDPAGINAVSYRNQMLTPIYKRRTKALISRLVQAHKASFAKFIQDRNNNNLVV